MFPVFEALGFAPTPAPSGGDDEGDDAPQAADDAASSTATAAAAAAATTTATSATAAATTNVLLVGEMDLSFAMDLSQHLRPGAHHLCATTYFDEDSIAKRIRGLFRNSARVLRKRGVDVQTNVDATRLDDAANLNRTAVTTAAAVAASSAAATALAATTTRAGGGANGANDGGGGGGVSCSGGDDCLAGQQQLLRQFDTIVFCFPRGSDMSGVRAENDDLLSGLFRSATHVLRPGGCVCDDDDDAGDCVAVVVVVVVVVVRLFCALRLLVRVPVARRANNTDARTWQRRLPPNKNAVCSGPARVDCELRGASSSRSVVSHHPPGSVHVLVGPCVTTTISSPTRSHVVLLLHTAWIGGVPQDQYEVWGIAGEWVGGRDDSVWGGCVLLLLMVLLLLLLLLLLCVVRA